MAHEACPVGRVGEVLWVDCDGDVVHRQDDYEGYPHGPRQGSVNDLRQEMVDYYTLAQDIPDLSSSEATQIQNPEG